MILIIVLYLVCAATFTISKITLSCSLPIFYIGIRMICAGILLLLWYAFRYGKFPKIRPADWLLFAQIAFFAIYAAYVLDLWSLQFLTSTESALVFNLSPFLSAFFSYLYFSERMTFKKWAGLSIGSISLIPLMYAQGYNYCVIELSQLFPLIALICSVASSAYGWVVMRELVAVRGYSFFFVNGVAMFTGGCCALLTSWAIESWSMPVINWTSFVFYTGLIIFFSNMIFSNLYSYLLKHYTATLLSFFGFLCPLFAALLGSIFLNETFNILYLYSFAGVFFGLLIFYQEELHQGYIK